MKKIKIAGIAFLLFILQASGGIGLPSGAAAGEYPFTVEPVYPENQVEPDAGYWYITAVNGQKQNLEAIVRNVGGRDIVVFVEAADCFTSTGGDLCYITANSSQLIGLTDERFMLAGMIDITKDSYALKPGEEARIIFPVTAPSIDEGEVLGGIRFYVVTSVPDADKSAEGKNPQFNLNIRRAMTVTVRLKYKAPGNLPAPGLSVGEAGFENETGSLYFSLVNLYPLINRNAGGRYEVYDEDMNRLFGGGFDLVRMAPKSFVRVPVKWDHPSPEPGKYTISVQPEGFAKPQVRSFELESEEIEIIDEFETPPGSAPQVPGKAADNMLLLYGGWLLFGATVTLTAILYFLRKKKKQ